MSELPPAAMTWKDMYWSKSTIQQLGNDLYTKKIHVLISNILYIGHTIINSKLPSFDTSCTI